MVSVFLAGLIASVLVGILLSCSSTMAATEQAGDIPSQEDISRLPADGGKEFNRLIHEKSPYLLQHARNPVDWYPWGEEAFERVKKEDKPVFLSVGYSTCHWCHVMERESFEHDDVAAMLNRNFVAIKVDREERPDLDEVYMTATQLLTSRGGWPNSVWLTPDGRPWYAGTYFPREDSPGRPGFKTVLTSLAEAWRTRRQDIEAKADQLATVLRDLSNRDNAAKQAQLDRDLITSAIESLLDLFDRQNGGMSGAPKFPPHTTLNLLIYEYRIRKNPEILEMITATLDGMARGGIHDHLGGGFHRYSTDARWFLPHFEKMLYDNAQLSRSYVDGYLITGDEDYSRVAIDTYEWVLRVMTDEEGGFRSAVDADSEGEEGKFYLWGRNEILDALGKEEGERFCRIYGVEEGGNFRDEATGKRVGTNVLYLKRPLAEVAKFEGMPLDELRKLLGKSRETLLQIRSKRVHPHMDDKVITAWTGLMIGSLAYGGQHLGEPRYIEAAERAAEFVLTNLYKDCRLLRTYRAGEARLNGYLDDYAFLADGLLDLYEATNEERYVDTAKALTETLAAHFRDAAGGFFFTSDDHEELLARTKDPFDKAVPSGNGVAARVLVRLGQLTRDRKYFDEVWSALNAFLEFMHQAPHGAGSLLLAAAMYLDDAARASEEPAASPLAYDPDARARKRPVTVEAFASHQRAAPGDEFRVALRLNIDEGWHVNSNAPIQNYLVPTSVALKADEGISVGTVGYPRGVNIKLEFSGEELLVYEGTLWILVPLTVREHAEEGPLRIELHVNVQACDDRTCLRPETLRLPLLLQVDSNGTDAPRHRGLFEGLKQP